MVFDIQMSFFSPKAPGLGQGLRAAGAAGRRARPGRRPGGRQLRGGAQRRHGGAVKRRWPQFGGQKFWMFWDGEKTVK